MDTIFALATARGRAGVAVVRISGPEALRAGCRLAGALEPFDRTLRRLTWHGELIDEALVLTFPEGRSFTGESVVELHLHGSIAVITSVLGALGTIDGLRPAQAGEFTHRAFENGRLDLSQVEALADLIDAETEMQRRQAVRALSGALGARAENWRGRLVRALALIEATIDFADEDVPVDVGPEVMELLIGVRDELLRESAGVHAAERIRDGFEVAILGAPNVGKSTLLNALAGREAAITSDVAGTTRDVIEVQMDLGGLPVTILDTAGLRISGDKVERIGIERAKARAAAADLRIHLVGPGDEPLMDVAPSDLVVGAKADLGEVAELSVSGLTGAGVDRLVSAITERLEPMSTGTGVAIRERHRLGIEQATEALGEVLERMDELALQPDLLAERLRDGLRAIDSLVGRVDVEHVLDEIFSSFCIGK
ncbi:tRNA uridine-5-carboxymethylaminomethyl(34) synthesis GTPase MnmE [Roseisalinus antarcticus]|uniref:tRNA modification GTPase MnmE n=1 Tax=Roseisalinus antarcticus TaxID=254357 RepID=A0A1Y5S3M9_9RHOB|nr:tRNA uridine-5-carboxymethylaminomethyl(34) synthesis GTPase MnmE [Roseisalinus antarcticus]SLN30897.1 tRNA modification GTPase MnmE [Roseisalinus antarcticus]